MKHTDTVIIRDQYGNIDVDFYLRQARQMRTDFIASQVRKLWHAGKHSIDTAITSAEPKPAS